MAKSVKNEPNKNGLRHLLSMKKNLQENCKHKKLFYQNKTMASMRSCTKGSTKFWSSLDKFGKIEKTDDCVEGISVNIPG